MYQKLLKKIKAELKSEGNDLQKPCSPAQLKKLRERSIKELGHDIPDEYAAFLAIANGLEWNGLQILATENTPLMGSEDLFIDGFVEYNLMFREGSDDDDYLIFAYDGTSVYTYHVGLDRYEVNLQGGLTDCETLDSFDELLALALEEHL